ncbi:MAG: beta-N-acetylhexosaminidase [Terriglobia bacterium]|nr:MAG: beta-N-acetylhexosaminidase [Terriglobia bacterium]
MRRFALICACFATASAAQLPLMPAPSKVTRYEGALRIDSGFRVVLTAYSDSRLMGASDRFAAHVAAQTGIPVTAGKALTLQVDCKERGSELPTLGDDESYQLDTTSREISLKSRTVTGALRGFATLEQLIEPGPDGFQVPAVRIQDGPRFPWRGLMLDAARHWMPVAVVKRNLDAMEAVKLNVFHWHLSDDQGFRVESRRFPRLAQLGSDGNFYTQVEIRQVVSYAQERGIRVIPEFDVPGHTTSWLVGYPEFASLPGPYAIARKWGVFQPTLDPSRETTYAFLDAFIGEMAALFPDSYFHIGGDEVDETQWKRSGSIQAFAREHQLATSHDLQAYFNQRLQKLLKKHGKAMVGWDEVLSPGLAPETIIQSWRGQASLAQAAIEGHGGLLSFGYYLDHLWPAGQHYGVDPLDGAAGNLTAEQTKHILGGEACMWSEYVSAETVDSRIWPRAAAIAERLWSPRETRDTDAMYARLANVSRMLEWRGVRHRSALEPMLSRLAGGPVPQPLWTLAGASEALGIEGRRNLRENASLEPLNRFADAVRPESDEVQALEVMVKRMASEPAAITELRANLTQWSLNEIRLQPLARNNSLLSEVLPLAANLSRCGKIGLRALELIEAGHSAPAGWVQEQNRELDRLEEPVAQVRLAAVRVVRALLAAVPSPAAASVTPQTLGNASVRWGNERLRNSAATVPNWIFEMARSMIAPN